MSTVLLEKKNNIAFITINRACFKGVEISELQNACQQLAANIMKSGPVAVKQAKYAINSGMNTDLQTGLEIEAKAYKITIPTEDRLEALSAFNEKRNPGK